MCSKDASEEAWKCSVSEAAVSFGVADTEASLERNHILMFMIVIALIFILLEFFSFNYEL